MQHQDRYIQLLKNTSVLYVVEIVSRLLLVFFLIYAARVMGVKGFGNFSYALALMMIVGVISDFGASSLMVKMSAQNSSIDKNFWAYTVLRAIITIFAILLVIVYLFSSEAEKDILYFSLLMGTGMVFGCYGQNMGFVFRGLNKMHIDGIIRLSISFITALLGIIALRFGLGLIGIGDAYLIAYVFSSFIAFRLNKKEAVIRLFPSVSFKDYMFLIKASFPFFVWMLLSIIYSRVDIIFLQHMRGSEEVGLYSAAGRVIDAIMLIPMGVYIAILPILSNAMAEKDMRAVESISNIVIKYMTYLGLFITCYIAFSSDKVIEVLYSSREFEGSALSLQILIWGIVASFIAVVPSALIISGPAPHMAAWLASISVGLIVLLSFIFIPIWGFLGASAVKLVIEIIGFILVVAYVNRYILKIKYSDFLKEAIYASLVTGVLIKTMKSLLFLPIYFFVFMAMLYLLKAISKEELIKTKELLIISFKKNKY
jgi:O-antigen/teichoic acid export membrane protein